MAEIGLKRIAYEATYRAKEMKILADWIRAVV